MYIYIYIGWSRQGVGATDWGKWLEVIQEAARLAKDRGHLQLDPGHVFAVLLKAWRGGGGGGWGWGGGGSWGEGVWVGGEYPQTWWFRFW